MRNLLEVSDLRVSFRTFDHRSEVVKGVSFRVPPGKTVALVGESGSGKSVISQAIMGILPSNGDITSGSIVFADPQSGSGGIDIAGLDRDGPQMRELRGGRIGMIFQEPMSSLSPIHRIGDQIGEAYNLHRGGTKQDARAASITMLEKVGFKNPERAVDMYSFELSGGLRQRAMLAMALICNPALLIADEPTTALDATVQAQVLKLMKELQRDIGMAILLITHDLGVVANMADEVVVIYHGEILERGGVEDIFRRPRHPYLQALMKAAPHFDMAPGERLVSLREARDTPPPPPLPPSDEVLLEARSLSKTYLIRSGSWFGKADAGTIVRAVSDVSFDVRRGECLGLVGESGSGKTTVSKLIMRAVSTNAGQVLFHGRDGTVDVTALEDEALRRFRPKMQMIFQDPVSSLSPRMTVLDIIREPLDIHNVGVASERARKVAGLMQSVGLDPRFLNRYPHSFSGGQRQRIGIARALALSPELIVCDEPVSALDVSVQAQVLNLLKDLQAESNLTYLFISHNLAVVNYMADRIAVMANGRIVEMAPRHALFANPVHPYTRTLLQAVPFPDLDRPLDFNLPSLRGASDMSRWPEMFRPDADGHGLVEKHVGKDHFVLARADADPLHLAA